MAVPGYVIKNKVTVLGRAGNFLVEGHPYLTECSLPARLCRQTRPLKSLTHWAAPDRVSYAEAIAATYTTTSVNSSFGPTWSTHWFRLEYEIPAEWKGEEIHLIWDTGSEALVWKDGKPLQGLTNENRRTHYVLTTEHDGSTKTDVLYIEVACNDVFGAGKGNQIAAPDPDKTYTLKKAEIATFDPLVYNLLMDMQLLLGMAKHLPETSNRGHQAMYTLNEMVNICHADSKDAHQRACDIARKFFGEKNGDSQHTMFTMGHCHIDTAWLWPYAETIRKCARSWSSTVRLMETYPDFTFACSQAQQFAWVKQHYPTLFKEIQDFAKKGQFLPTGGTWVEMDGNIPSGEAFIRQFMLGQYFFEKEFGKRCNVFWLPDTFGYSAQLPQLIKLCDMPYFVTQKMSWNVVNKFPHHTFWWAGIDGTRVLTHFPPGNCYCMKASVDEVLMTVDNYADKGRCNSSMFLYGWGDGGQGPTSEMIEQLRRMTDVDGLPRVKMSSPEAFFAHVEEEGTKNLCVWNGELYLEMHNGTYTTQAKTKLGNRKCEILLHDIEALSTMAWITRRDAFEYPAVELERLWQLLLLNQFHDVLPGSSIGMVYKDALDYYRDIRKSGNRLLVDAENELFSAKNVNLQANRVVFNTLCWDRCSVIRLPEDDADSLEAKNQLYQLNEIGKTLVLAKIPASGYSVLRAETDLVVPVSTEKINNLIYLRNEHLIAVVDECGRIVKINLTNSNRNAISPQTVGNQFVIFDDVPLFWDAWDVMDYHLETRKLIEKPLQHAVIVEEGPLRGTIKVSLKISDKSYIQQYISLDAGSRYLQFHTEVAWHESHKFLKVEFPVDVLSQQASYDIQFGHIQRPTHFNTSWDWAKYEVCGHKWADLSEYNFGVAVLSDSKYGWSCIGNVLRLSLLRAPKAPDDQADMGTHRFTYALMPHSGSLQDAGVIQAAYELNYPLHLVTADVPEGACEHQSYFTVDSPAVILETVKKAERLSNAVVLRLYEAYGGSASATVNINFKFNKVQLCNALEDPLGDAVEVTGSSVKLHFRPFQILSLIVHV